MSGPPSRIQSVLSAMFVVAVLATAGCSDSSVASSGLSSATHPANKQVVDERFTVLYTAAAVEHAEAARINLSDVVNRALGRINVMLPGPKTIIDVGYYPAAHLIPQAGVNGFTSPDTGRIIAAFGTTAHASINQALALWFPRDLAHEVNHSVRVLAGPGFGFTLLEGTITEGIATTFDQAAFRGPLDPWADAITPQQECALWRHAQPLLGDEGLYDLWMLGGPGIPRWTAFTIGYHIVSDYRSHHPNVTWAALTSASAAKILAGSHYQPCSR